MAGDIKGDCDLTDIGTGVGTEACRHPEHALHSPIGLLITLPLSWKPIYINIRHRILILEQS